MLKHAHTMGKGIYLLVEEMNESFMPMVVKGNENADKLLTVLTTFEHKHPCTKFIAVHLSRVFNEA